jgi:transporter family-2 protein
MVNLGYIITAVVIGFMVSLQPAINAVMARELSSSLLASTISIGISFILIFLAWQVLGKGEGELSQIRQLPWWIVIGGAAGMIFVIGGLMVAPALGFALFFICIIAGQLLGSTLIDQIGAFGLPIKPASGIKLLGLGCVLAGATLVQYGNSQ